MRQPKVISHSVSKAPLPIKTRFNPAPIRPPIKINMKMDKMKTDKIQIPILLINISSSKSSTSDGFHNSILLTLGFFGG